MRQQACSRCGWHSLSDRALRAQLDGYLDRVIDRDFKDAWQDDSMTVKPIPDGYPMLNPGLSFESQESAQGLADNASLPPDASVTFRSVDVYDVVRDV